MRKEKVKGRRKNRIYLILFLLIFVVEYLINLSEVGFANSFDYVDFPYAGTVLLAVAYGIIFVAVVMHRADTIAFVIADLSHYWDYSKSPAEYVKRSTYVKGSNKKQEKSDDKDKNPLLGAEDQATLELSNTNLKKVKRNSKLLFLILLILHSVGTIYYYEDPVYWLIPLAVFLGALVASELRYNFIKGYAKGSTDRTFDTRW